MWDFNANIPLNVVTNGLLSALIAALMFICRKDALSIRRKAFSYYTLWLFIYFLYLLTDTAFYLSIYLEFSDLAVKILYSAYIFISFFCAIPGLKWVVALIEEKREISKFMPDLFCSMCILVPIIYLCAIWGLNYDVVNVYISQTEFTIVKLVCRAWHFGITVLLVFLIKNRRYIGETEILALFLFLASTVLSDAQTYWRDIPGNIFGTAIMFAIYIDVWQKQKDELINQNMLLAQQEKQLAEKELELTNARVTLMMSQIQPHFLYNTLSSISFLCTKDPQKARQVTNDFVVYLRGNLDGLSSQKLITFSEELEHIKTYLKIEKVRFDDTLTVEFDIKATGFDVPALSIQPLVENAVKYGVCKKLGGGTVSIKTRETELSWVITISDDGSGFDVSKVSFTDGRHHGINNSRMRLEYQCGGTVDIDSTVGVGTTVTVTIPKNKGLGN